MLVDMHVHTSGISKCCRVSAEDGILFAKECGYDGIVVTNHYADFYYQRENHRQWIEQYIAEWDKCRKIGKQVGIKVFCGAEVTYGANPSIHLLLYGVDEAFLRKHLFLCDKSQQELYELCEQNGCALMQAHPFRNGTTMMDPRFLHGAEVNCHPLYGRSAAAEVEQVVQAEGLAITAGCDYHGDTYRCTGGSFLPDDIQDEKQLAQYLLTATQFKLQIHEPQNVKTYQKEYRISR